MAGSVFLLDAVLPLQALGFFSALLPKSWSWVFWPTHLLFPHSLDVTSSITVRQQFALSFYLQAWRECILLFGAFLAIFLVYLVALYVLPRRISYRYLLLSTLVLGIMYVLIPIVTSQDMFLYIGYARMTTLYHLNPFTVAPAAIHGDPIYSSIFWKQQPSLYGPTWIGPIAALQWLALKLGLAAIAPVVLLLRLFGLIVHLGSTQLIWMLSGRLQGQNGSFSLHRRKQVTLAFAWNPLVLFETCVNVHADVLMLFLILLAIWVLMYGQEKNASGKPIFWIGVAVVLALATGIKINVAIFVPGLLLYAWTQARGFRTVLLIGASYLITVVVLYIPFWLHGSMFTALFANPSTVQNVNSLPEFLTNLYKSIIQLRAFPATGVSAVSVERVTHALSILIFVGAYGWLYWKVRHSLYTTVHLIYWMAIAWLLYCLFGSPWFWSWYTITFLGLLALAASVARSDRPVWIQRLSTMPSFPLGVTILAFSMFSLYGLFSWGFQHSSISGLPGFHWSYLRGLWPWLLPLLALFALTMVRHVREKSG